MGTEIDLARLAEPFPARDVEWRVGQCGKTRDGRVWAKVLAYITNRAIMDRLDAVCGPGNWRNEFREWTVGGQAGVLCGISILVGGQWVTKWDGAENTDIEAVKGGLSSAMKRAAVQWGIGRYLYDLEEGWAVVLDGKEKDANHAKTKDGAEFWWKPPPLPAWALPKSHQPPLDLSREGNVMHPAAQAAAKAAHPQPRTVVSPAQLDAIRATMDKLGLTGADRLPKTYGFDVRPNHLTPEQADQLLLKLRIKLTDKLLAELEMSLADVRIEDDSVTAATPGEMDLGQCNAALDVLLAAKERVGATV